MFFKRGTILYHTNGRIHIQGYTLFNKRIGDFEVFDEDGNLINRWHYENGEKTKALGSKLLESLLLSEGKKYEDIIKEFMFYFNVNIDRYISCNYMIYCIVTYINMT